MVEKTHFRPRDQFLVFGAPDIYEAEIEEVIASMRSGWLGTGPKVARFEDDFRRYKGAAHAVAVNSGTAAMHLSAIAAGLQPGDEVITTAMTFCSTVNVIIHAGATPVLVDIDPVTMNINPDQIEAKITPRTRAILPVHFAGRPCNMDAICELAGRHGLVIIEDCAHAIETEYKGRKAGLFGDFGCFSFYVTKNVITGEGGMVVTSRKEYADRIKILALHGMSSDAWKRFSDEGYKHYQVIYPGFKYNMMDIQAAIGLHQLSRVEANLKRRNEIWQTYSQAFAELPVGVPAPDEPNTVHARHLYTLLIDQEQCGISRDEFMRRLYKRGIGTGVHYIGVHLHPYYREQFGFLPEDFPNATWISERTVSIPLSPKLTEADVEDVIGAVKVAVS
jgi:dTDP-4-amino-4,6-dideoxygalactose transaminase